jgi:hypothetical protein
MPAPNENETRVELYDRSFSRIVFSGNHNGSVSYNFETKRFEYANGKEATTGAAMEQLYSGIAGTKFKGDWKNDVFGYLTKGYQVQLTDYFGRPGAVFSKGNQGMNGSDINGYRSNNTTAYYLEGLGLGSGASNNNLLADINTGIGALGTIIGAETASMDFLIRNNYKSATSMSGFAKLRSTQQAWRTINTLGKTGAKALKYAKNLGYLGAAAGVGIATYQMIDNPTIGNATRLAVQGAAIGVAFIPVVGWGISIGIGAADLIWAISFIIG